MVSARELVDAIAERPEFANADHWKKDVAYIGRFKIVHYKRFGGEPIHMLGHCTFHYKVAISRGLFGYRTIFCYSFVVERWKDELHSRRVYRRKKYESALAELFELLKPDNALETRSKKQIRDENEKREG